MYKVKNITKDPRRLDGKIIMPGNEIEINQEIKSNNIFEVTEVKNKKEDNK